MPQPNNKIDYPVSDIRRFLEPGPVVLVSSCWQKQTDIMTMGWHMVMEFSPSLIGCIIASGNHSHDMVRNSGECVINIPSASLIDTVVGIGNCSGSESDKFSQFNLTPRQATNVGAPLIDECYASFECCLYDDAMVELYNLFIFEVIKAHVSPSASQEQSLHYQGMGQFMLPGSTLDRKDLFRPDKLN